MKTKLLLAAGLAAVSMASVAIHKANAVTDDGDITAEIIAAIDVDCSTALLDFGQIIPDGVVPSTVDVDTTGAAVIAGGSASHLGGSVAGQCSISGSAIPADIDVSAFTVLSDGPGGGADMTLSNFVLAYDGGPQGAAPIVANLDPSGAPLLVGATLTVGAAQVAGTYTGTFTVEVDYQ